MNNLISFCYAKDIYENKLLQHANFLRALALAVDHNPDVINEHIDHPAMQQCFHQRESSCVVRTKIFETLSFGDAGVLLGLPGPSLSGQIINVLGTQAQKDKFYESITRNNSRTFLAVTEPEQGSDAVNLASSFKLSTKADIGIINAEKCFIGNGAIADVGVILVRKNSGPLGHVALIVYPDENINLQENSNALLRYKLPTVGLKGASLSQLSFRNYRVKASDLLGQHLRPTQQGLMALITTFNRMRTCVAGLALGTAQAALEYILQHRQKLNLTEARLFNQLVQRLQAIRNITYKAAQSADNYPLEISPISQAKVLATNVAEDIILSTLQFFDGMVFIDHPLLEKWFRDVFGFEYMEGTSHIHYRNILPTNEGKY